MIVEKCFMINLYKRMLPDRRGSNPRPPDHQSDATEPSRPAEYYRPQEDDSVLLLNTWRARLMDILGDLNFPKLDFRIKIIIFGLNNTF